MWGRQTEKAVESAVHEQSIGWRLHFIICPCCQKMQVKIEPMSHLSFHYFRSHAGSQRLCNHPGQAESLDLVALHACMSVFHVLFCLFPPRFVGPFCHSAEPSEKRRGIWGPRGHGVTPQPCEAVAVISTPHCTLHNSPAWLQSSTLACRIFHT